MGMKGERGFQSRQVVYKLGNEMCVYSQYERGEVAW